MKNQITAGVRTQWEVDGVIKHEMGHDFGLDHYNYNDYPRSVMYPTPFTNLMYNDVCGEDNEAINAKYN